MYVSPEKGARDELENEQLKYQTEASFREDMQMYPSNTGNEGCTSLLTACCSVLALALDFVGRDRSLGRMDGKTKYLGVNLIFNIVQHVES